jgi:organic radical activating enzyme
LSSKWYDEVSKNPEIYSDINLKIVKLDWRTDQFDEQVWKDFASTIHNIKYVTFTGGEPLLDKSHVLLLNYFVDNDLSKDIDLQATRFAGWLGYRQRFHRFFATTSSLCLFQLKGNDKWSQEISRLERNSHFRAFCVEVQQRFEFIFASTETFSPIYNFPGNYSSKKSFCRGSVTTWVFS